LASPDPGILDFGIWRLPILFAIRRLGDLVGDLMDGPTGAADQSRNDEMVNRKLRNRQLNRKSPNC
jgi:hypothetical protein